ncbi:hypothetical protein [Allorhodopirellula heiligendammensis]|uniref:Uncharacterized protein n=1 Tax=Allorhodopirellula heiligendammensis TaxID=2714739 RepID=A0A5C6C596_9BACT|nr:hypothetical protein [Allorhodopirellula heiligendammensis]TWU19272.1 hypothetical protein Poly21_14440 [Allorhodopirellula heiligendammensis]|tara:strand:+ start:306 stop:524 length:219 start_codon:yes stop_codon:yes gene_type:complete
MTSNKPWLDGASAEDRAIVKMWQGGPLLLIGVISTAGTAYFLGFVWIWTVLIGIVGLFWFLTGLITYLTGAE